MSASWPAAVLTLAGLIALNEARKLRVGSVVAPGPGFFPLALAVAFCVVCLIMLVRAWRTQPAGAGPPATERREPWKAVATMTALGLYAFALEPLGFVVSTFGLLLFFFRALERQRWWVAVAGALGTSCATYVVFRVWLQVRLPPGPWGF